ncbi:hypothetical protein DBR33_02785 [Stenotrophomonas sp. HMWF022]|uniref:hypothetical protein n=1 Tax=Stenotrophomonas sp. HMWF023 TaxID=2056859 RepID=UPI000D34D452|nr:hypothetical protein [Stenotrophomonas sp. HMWF023]PTS77738.1 hypothetical protein DBR20_07400 [Stenotrophomonas sp. HMWF023]PTT56141.1 hypothetical protein DBR33_02785 [Stenotrophomonas sp. HMWF022]
MKKAIVMMSLLLGLVACKDGISMSQKAGSAISGTAADFVAGLGEGVDKRMAVTLLIDPAVAERGLSITMGKSRGAGSKDVAVYVVAGTAFNGRLVARALDAEGVEIGRAVVDEEFSADDARYVTFKFNEEMDSQLVRTYALSVR